MKTEGYNPSMGVLEYNNQFFKNFCSVINDKYPSIDAETEIILNNIFSPEMI